MYNFRIQALKTQIRYIVTSERSSVEKAAPTSKCPFIHAMYGCAFDYPPRNLYEIESLYLDKFYHIRLPLSNTPTT